MLPPSGHLYAYPASIGEEMEDEFVASTEQDARILIDLLKCSYFDRIDLRVLRD